MASLHHAALINGRASLIALFLSFFLPDVIAVNVDCAKNDGEFLIFVISDIPSALKGKEMISHHRFCRMIPQDVFCILDDPAVEHHSVCLHSRNQVMLKVPATLHSLLNHCDEIEMVVPDIFTAVLDNS